MVEKKSVHLDSVTVDTTDFLALCGKNLPQPEQNNYEVNRDCIRRICYAIEDYNALYLDEEFARQTRWGGIIAPPGYLYSHGRQFFSWASHAGAKIVDSSGREYASTDNAGAEWDFYLPVRPGEMIISHCSPTGAQVKRGARAGIFVITSSECRLVNGRGDLVAKYRDHSFNFSARTQHEIGSQAASYPPMPSGQTTRGLGGFRHRFFYPPDGPVLRLDNAGTKSYGECVYSIIPRRYDRHNKYFEDVQDGMQIPEYAIGPLTTDHIRRWEMHTIDFWRPEGNRASTLTQDGIVPDLYAAGSLRTAWFGSMLTRWAGPNAWIRKLSYWNHEWVLVGYKYFCRGEVVKKYVEDGIHYVECNLRLENDDVGIVTNIGHAVVELLSRKTV